MEQRALSPLRFALLGFPVAIGLALAGYWISEGLFHFKMAGNLVTVKGLAEREVKSDRATWRFPFKYSSNNLGEASNKVLKDKETIFAFLKLNGFSDAEMDFSSFRVIDLFSREYNSGVMPPNRYIVEALVTLKSNNVDLVESSSKKIDQLIKAGIIFDEGSYETNPKYFYTKLNDIRPQMTAEATKSARKLAEQFAADSGAKVGGIASATQGTFQITGTDGRGENEPDSDVKTLVKKVRVVSTIDYFLK
jgi:hypothetical protein